MSGYPGYARQKPVADANLLLVQEAAGDKIRRNQRGVRYDNRYPETLELCSSSKEHSREMKQLQEQHRAILEVLKGAGII